MSNQSAAAKSAAKEEVANLTELDYHSVIYDLSLQIKRLREGAEILRQQYNDGGHPELVARATELLEEALARRVLSEALDGK